MGAEIQLGPSPPPLPPLPCRRGSHPWPLGWAAPCSQPVKGGRCEKTGVSVPVQRGAETLQNRDLGPSFQLFPTTATSPLILFLLQFQSPGLLCYVTWAGL